MKYNSVPPAARPRLAHPTETLELSPGPPMRPGALDFLKHPSVVNGKPLPYTPPVANSTSNPRVARTYKHTV